MNHHALQPTVQIGKNGITEEIIEEIKRQIKQNKMIKVKLLRAFVESHDRKAAARELAEKTNSILEHQIGFIVVLKKKKKK